MKGLHPLTEFRYSMQLSRSQFARLTGVGYQTLSNIENGRSRHISRCVMAALLNVDVPSDLPEQHEAWLARQLTSNKAGDSIHVAPQENVRKDSSLPSDPAEEEVPLPYAYDGEETRLYSFD